LVDSGRHSVGHTTPFIQDMQTGVGGELVQQRGDRGCERAASLGISARENQWPLCAARAATAAKSTFSKSGSASITACRSCFPSTNRSISVFARTLAERASSLISATSPVQPKSSRFPIEIARKQGWISTIFWLKCRFLWGYPHRIPKYDLYVTAQNERVRFPQQCPSEVSPRIKLWCGRCGVLLRIGWGRHFTT
jgi:hypothetical protein